MEKSFSSSLPKRSSMDTVPRISSSDPSITGYTVCGDLRMSSPISRFDRDMCFFRIWFRGVIIDSSML